MYIIRAKNVNSTAEAQTALSKTSLLKRVRHAKKHCQLGNPKTNRRGAQQRLNIKSAAGSQWARTED